MHMRVRLVDDSMRLSRFEMSLHMFRGLQKEIHGTSNKLAVVKTYRTRWY